MVNYSHNRNGGKTWFNQITDDNKEKAGKCGAINVILDAMKRYINFANICTIGCPALKNIAVNGESLFK